MVSDLLSPQYATRFHASKWDCGWVAVTTNVNVGAPVLTMAQTGSGTFPGCCRICSRLATGTLLSIINLAKRPGSVACPISEAGLVAENSLMLIVFRTFGWPKVLSSMPSQKLSQIWPADRSGK